MNTNIPIAEINSPDIQKNIPLDTSTEIIINQCCTGNYKHYKHLDEYKLSHGKNLNILTTTSLINKPEKLLNSCLKLKIKDLEKDICERPNYRFKIIKDRLNSTNLETLNPIRLDKLIQLSEANKNVLYRFIEKLYNSLHDAIKNVSKTSIIWVVHNLKKDDLITDNNFIDNLIISLINDHLEMLSDPKEALSKIKHIALINSFLESNNNIYYMSGEYAPDKSIRIKKIQIKDISAYKYPNKMSKFRFHFEIDKQEDSEAIKTLNRITEDLHLSIFKEQVNKWINYSIKKVTDSLEFIAFNKLTLATSENDGSTSSNTDSKSQEIATQLEKLKNLSTTNKNKLCNFIAYFYQSLVNHKKKIVLNNKDRFASVVLWETHFSITGECIDKLVIASIKYCINILSKTSKTEDKKYLDQIDSFMSDAGFLYQIYIKQLDDKNNFEIVSGIPRKKFRSKKTDKENTFTIVSAIPEEKNGDKFIGIRFHIKTIS